MDWHAIIPDRIPVLVPRRADNGARDAVWDALRDRVWRFSRVVEGYHTDGPFNRSAALNTAARLADEERTWDLAVIADADSFTHPAQLAGAIGLAEQTDRVVLAHSRWVNVNPDENILDDGYIVYDDDRTEWAFTVSSLLVVPRRVWDTVNGFDERFEGWGREDNAFIRAVKVLTEPPLRIDGPVFHLAHDRPTEDTHRNSSALWRANEARWSQYRRATSTENMRHLVAGNR